MPLRGKDVREVTPKGRSKIQQAKQKIELAIREEGLRADTRCSGAGRRIWGQGAEAQPPWLRAETTDEELREAGLGR